MADLNIANFIQTEDSVKLHLFLTDSAFMFTMIRDGNDESAKVINPTAYQFAKDNIKMEMTEFTAKALAYAYNRK